MYLGCAHHNTPDGVANALRAHAVATKSSCKSLRTYIMKCLLREFAEVGEATERRLSALEYV